MRMESETPVKEQAQKLAEVGAQLKAAREAHDLSLADISGKTKIQLRFLEAIEAGNLDELPAPVYTQGFIQRFAEVLGLTSDALNSWLWSSHQPCLHRPRDTQTATAAWRPPLPLLLAIVLAAVGIVGLGALTHHLIQSSSVAETQSPRPSHL